MGQQPPPRFWLLSLLACFFLLISSLSVVECSHFAYGTILWTQGGTTSSSGFVGNGVYSMDFRSAFRTDYQGWPFTPYVGATLQVGTLYFYQVDSPPSNTDTPPYGLCSASNSYNGGRTARGYKYSKTINLLVTFVYTDDWFRGTSAISVTAQAGKNYWYGWCDCCRIQTLTDGNGGSSGDPQQMSGWINSAYAQSPTTEAFPRQYFEVGRQSQFNYPVVVNNPLSTVASVVESTTAYSLVLNLFGLGTTTTQGVNGKNFHTNLGDSFITTGATAGRLTWTPQKTGLYAAQVRMTEAPSGIYIVLDLIFQVCSSCAGISISAPATATFYPGALGSFNVVATTSKTSGNVITVTTTELPPGGSFVASGSQSVVNNLLTATYTLYWQPTLTSVSVSVCFTGSDTAGEVTVGSTCTLLLIGTGDILLVTGIIRDISSSVTDFVTNSAVDSGTTYVTKTLTGSTLTKDPAVSSTTTAQQLAEWFTTASGVNLQQAQSIVCNNAPEQDKRIFKFSQLAGSTSASTPDNPWYPIDGLLYGNDNSGLTHNTYFTYQANVQFTYYSGQQFTFYTADDLFVYIGKQLYSGWNLGGTSTPSSPQKSPLTVNLDQHLATIPAYQSIVSGTILPMDIYYVHRSSFSEPYFQIEITAAPQCDSFSNGVKSVNLQTFTSSSMVLLGQASISTASTTSGYLNINGGASADSGAAWFASNGNIKALKLQYGFQANFSAQWTGKSEGFAFVLQAQGPAARGAAGSSLGYGGVNGVVNSLVIEFDDIVSADQSDPSYPHASIHISGINLPNTASESDHVNVVLGQSASGVALNWDNGTVYNIRVEFTPASQVSSAPYSYLNVYVNQLVLPVVQAVINATELDLMWGGSAYIGFTSGTSTTNFAPIYISNFALTVVPVSASKSFATASPVNIQAGTTGSMTVQLMDVCGNYIRSGGDTVVATLNGATQNVVDNQNGQYTITYSPTITGSYTIVVTYGGTAISGSPFPFTVVAGPTYAPTSLYSFSPALLSPNPPTQQVSIGNLDTIVITSRDKYGNVHYGGLDPWLITFSPSLSNGFTGPTAGAALPVPDQSSQYTVTFTSGVSGTYQMSATLNGLNLASTTYTIVILAGAAYAPNCVPSGSALTSTTAGVAGTFVLTLKDQYNNLITYSNVWADKACGSGASASTCYLQSNSNPAVQPPITCQWSTPLSSTSVYQCTFTGTLADTYKLVMTINSQIMPANTTVVTIVPGPAWASKCVGVAPSAGVVAGTLASGVYIQAEDFYSNLIQVPLPNGASFAATVDSTNAPFVTSTNQVGGNIALGYAGQGRYALNFNCTKATTLTFTATLSGSAGSNGAISSAFTALVVPAPPATPSTITFPSGSTTASAGTANSVSFILTSEDQFGNLRSGGGDAQQFVITLADPTTGSTVPATTSLTASNPNYQYNGAYSYTVAGTYLLKAVLASNGQSITFPTGSSQSVTIVPGPTHYSHCTVFGPGVGGGVYPSTQYILVSALDAYNNAQLNSVTDSWTVQILYPSSQVYATISTPVSHVGNTYNFTYQVPAADAFVIQITLNSGTSGQLPPLNALGVLSNSIFYVSLTNVNSGNYQSAQVGIQSQFQINYFSDAQWTKPATLPNGRFTVTLVPALPASVANSQSLIITNAVVTLNSPADSHQLASYTPSFQLPAGVHAITFNITVSAGGIAAFIQNADSGAAQVTITAGKLSKYVISSTITSVKPLTYFPVTVIPADLLLNPIAVSGQPQPSFASAGTAWPANFTVNDAYSWIAQVQSPGIVAPYSYSASYVSSTTSYVSNSVQIDVVAGPPAIVSFKSLIGSTSTFLLFTADNTATFSMTITDAESNAISASVSQQITFTWGFTTQCPTGGVVTTQQTSSNGWTVTASCRRAGNYQLGLNVFLGGSSLSHSSSYSPSSSDSVIVSFGAFSNATVGATTPAGTLNAGTTFSFPVSCFDAYGNPWAVSGGLGSTYTVTPAGSSLAGPALPPSIADQQPNSLNGVFVVSVSNTLVQVAGIYQFSFYASGQLLSSISNSVTVIAGAPYLPTTLYPLSIPTAQVSVPLQYSFVLRDQFSNVIINQVQGLLYTLVVFSSKPQCTAGTPSINQNPNYLAVSGAFTSSNGGATTWNAASNSYTITVTPQEVGTYTVIALPAVSCGNSIYNCDVANISCVSQAGLSTVVSAGYPDARQSFLEGLPASGVLVAGHTLQLTVVLRDIAGNWVSSAGSSVITFATVFNAVTTSVTARDNQDGTFSISIAPTSAGSWNLNAALNGTQLQCLNPSVAPFAVNNNTKLSSAYVTPCTITVIPSIPWGWSQRTSPTPIAGQVSYVDLQVTDSYGNAVANPLVNYTYNIYGASQLVTSYTFQGTLSCTPGSGVCRWSFLSTWYGPVQLSVKLQFGPSPVCIAQQIGQANPADYQCADNSCVTQISRCNSAPQAGIIPLTVLQAACGAENPQTPYRCSDTGACVAHYSDCTGSGYANATKCSQVTCSVNGACASNAFSCPCPQGYTRNPYTQACQLSGTGTGAAPICDSKLTLCTGTVATCVANPQTDCPSVPVCPPGYYTCPDATCSATANGCQDYASQPSKWTACSNGTVTCLDGSCRSSVDQCSTLVSCGAGKVLCPDNSCQASASQCYEVYPCYNANYPSTTGYRCRDGSCKDTPAHCPTTTTCPQGYVLCENGQCASSQSACVAAHQCGAASVRCPDGSCRDSLYQCPSVLTCPTSAPVRCSDGTCQPVLALCNAPVQCPSNTKVCPDGSCAASLDQCPAGTTCRSDQPVLCPDGSCTTDQSLCGPTDICPTQTPLRCPDGSCRVSLVDCPSRTACSTPGLPIRCFDGTCVASSDQCPSTTTFQCTGSTPLRCPDGSCAAALALCASPVTCPIGAQLCQDGSCRASCTNAAAISCPGAAPLACPSPLGSPVCVSNAAQCPQFPVCPLSAPVRCMDATCVASVSACPPLPNIGVLSVVPCADGSWSTSAVLCATPVSCPTGLFKCLDNTCRQNPDDCPLWSTCSANAAAPYRCPTGACFANPWDTSCVSGTGQCYDATKPVRCPGSAGLCVASVSQCPVGTPANPTADPLAQCPSTKLVQCRDGTCRIPTACADTTLTCPAALPVRCDVGTCVATQDECPRSNANGIVCPAGQQQCQDGSCVIDTNTCSFKTCPSGVTVQPDGTCPTGSYTQCLFRCWDGTCAETSSNSATFATDTNLCIEGAPLSVNGGASTAIGNVCPLQLPHQCSNGLCVQSSMLCPTVTTSTCPSSTPFQCANGLCMKDSRSCPVVWSICPVNAKGDPGVRCSDGTCVSDSTLCPLGRAISNGKCPNGNPQCPSTANLSPGLCSTTSDTTGCLVIDCPANTQFASINCGSVAGIQPNLCIPVTVTTPAQCQQYVTAILPAGNGCPNSQRVKCWDGACVSDSSQCRLYNGCPPSTPYRCTTGDKSCQTSSSLCSTTTPPPTMSKCPDGTYASSLASCLEPNGCSVLTPVRCADGTCKKYPASAIIPANYDASQFCQAVTGCSAPLFACYDGSCAASSAQCPISTLCTGYKCPSGACVSNSNQCNTTSGSIGQCPSSAPFVCPNGLCVSSSALCSTGPSVGTSTGTSTGSTIINGGTSSTGGSASGPTQSDPNAGAVNTSPPPNTCSSSNQVLCFDGSCAASYSACITHAQAINGKPTGTDLTSMLGACQTSTDVMCANGQCVPSALVATLCAVIPACSANLTRCGDGSCQVNCPSVSVCSFPGYQPNTRARCEDGTCRLQCLPYDGCPVWLPYHCPNRECASDATQCSAAQVGQMWTFNPETIVPWSVTASGRRLLSSTQVQLLEQHIRALGSKESADLLFNANVDSVSALPASVLDVLNGGYESAPCYSNCRAQVKGSGTFIINPNVDNLLTVAVANGQVQSWIQIPAGALGLSSSTTSATIKIDAVGEGTVRTAENRVVLSRRGAFGSYMTFAEGVISPMLSITLDSNVKLPLTRNITIRSAVDMNWNVDPVDRCLASLLQIEPNTLGFGGWQCQGAVTQRTDLAPYIFEATVNNNGIYAFIISPVETSSQVNESSWAQKNAVWIALGIIGIVAIGLMVFYWMQRLHRYRGKLHEEREQVKKQREEVEEMEQFGGHAGRKDDEVEMMSNPMVVQMKDMQARLDRKAMELQQAETAQRQAETAVRQEHITQLKSDRDNLQSELERLRAQLSTQTKTTGRPVAMDVPRPAPMGMAPVVPQAHTHPYASPYGGYPTTADSTSMPGALPESTTGRTEFSPQASMRPKKKGIE